MKDYPQAIATVDHVEPVPRRVRATLGDVVVIDTTRALYLWEWPFYPQFLIPAADVAEGVLVDEPGSEQLDRGTVSPVGLKAGDAERSGAGRRYRESSLPGVAGTVRFDWKALDAWYEEDERVFVHPRNPYVRVDALRSSRAARVELDGVVLAESSAPVLVFETGLPTRYFFDRTAVDFSHLRATETETECPYKGRTTGYWTAETPSGTYEDVAWSYDFPTRQLLPIAGMVAFYNETVDLIVDGERLERPKTHFVD